MFENHKMLWKSCRGQLLLFVKCLYVSNDFRNRLNEKCVDLMYKTMVDSGGDLQTCSDKMVCLVKLYGFKFSFRGIPNSIAVFLLKVIYFVLVACMTIPIMLLMLIEKWIQELM